jgi:hypothetical protein
MLRRFSFLFRKLPFLLVLVILGTVFLEPFLPLVMKQAVYAMALSITMGILFVLPFIIFCLLLKAMIVLSKKATAVILLVLVLVCVSNFLSTFLAHFVGGWIYHFNFSLLVPPEESHVLIPLWSFTLPKLVNNSQAFKGDDIGEKDRARSDIFFKDSSLFNPHFCRGFCDETAI